MSGARCEDVSLTNVTINTPSDLEVNVGRNEVISGGSAVITSAKRLMTKRSLQLKVEPCTDHLDSCLGHYMCIDGRRLCILGWTGELCRDKEIGSFPSNLDCPSNMSCENNGTCFNGTCCCEMGFTGPACETVLSPCDSRPCVNNGTCVDDPYVGYRCECIGPFYGDNCEMMVVTLSVCDSSPCLNNGTCVDVNTSYTCQCPGGYSGEHCEYHRECRPMHNCSGHYTCNIVGDRVCDDGWFGIDCKQRNYTSVFNPECPLVNNFYGCVSNATCSGGMCCCLEGYEGFRCEVETLECESLPCQNGGYCVDLVDFYYCLCAAGFTGVNCEKGIFENVTVNLGSGEIIESFTASPGTVTSKQALNKTTVIDNGQTTFTVSIATESNKTTVIDSRQTLFTLPTTTETTTSTTFAGEMMFDDFPSGYFYEASGEGMEPGKMDTYACIPEDSCKGHYYCRNNSQGTNEIICRTGWKNTSNKCRERNITGSAGLLIDEECPMYVVSSDGSVCKNGGTCFNQSCCCVDGYEGVLCEAEVLECRSSPCQNGGRCEDLLAGYNCLCANGGSLFHFTACMSL